MNKGSVDAFRLDRFVVAQADFFDRAMREIAGGRKRSHWMWFVFPQLRGLGASAESETFAIGSIEEARAYLAHPTLGPRLRDAARACLAHRDRPISEVFGWPDDLKFRSSMTLFALAEDETPNCFQEALEAFCGGQGDLATLEILDA